MVEETLYDLYSEVLWGRTSSSDSIAQGSNNGEYRASERHKEPKLTSRYCRVFAGSNLTGLSGTAEYSPSDLVKYRTVCIRFRPSLRDTEARDCSCALSVIRQGTRK